MNPNVPDRPPAAGRIDALPPRDAARPGERSGTEEAEAVGAMFRPPCGPLIGAVAARGCRTAPARQPPDATMARVFRVCTPVTPGGIIGGGALGGWFVHLRPGRG